MDQKKSPINYIYFLGLFGFLILLMTSSIFTKENLGGSQVFFLLYAAGQILLEVTLFIFISLVIRKYLNTFCYATFIGITFFALLIHTFDFLMDRILDLSAFEALRIFVFAENLENFIYLLDASGIPLWGWFVVFGLIGSVPFIGYLLYKATNQICLKKPLHIRHTHLLQVFICVPVALLLWDFSASKIVHPDGYTAFIQSLPWKFTFMQPQNVIISLPGSMRPPQDEKAIAKAIQQDQTVLNKKPNIYLFVVESLREDAITEEIAPNLHTFKNENIHFDTALSNGNATHISWFSIFHSQYPYHWENFQKNWKMGSPALALLKKWGYQIHLYSSAQLGYYGMERLMFGNELQLLDTRHTFHHAAPLNAADSDAQTLVKLQKELRENSDYAQGQVFIIFWDCTHFDYSWPKKWAPKFTPFAQESAYFKAFQSKKTIQQIKNRYHNAVNYMDSLFGKFLNNLPNKDEAIVLFTGDHGEEFFEHGHLFHNSHLTKEQTNVPLYLKLNRSIPKQALASQMDLFPTLIEHLSNHPAPFLEGNSLIQKTKNPFVVTARFNAGQTPYEFSIHSEKNKLIAQFMNRKSITESTELQIRSLRTLNDEFISEFEDSADAWVQKEFGPALNDLFPQRNPN
ncbi:MAG: hypothetical protein COT85_07555 [Chlamydiae bacterium CG10_big_fil_rev_8_21_14_0_10_42_34]|nr:MAG: hypothetical protein COT85_07555 [Chlamydiae bacterium CG10_big_fil_rev_8_21_14_0_10_42_34]